MEIDYRTEHARMIRALESIERTVCDMLDPVRRAGPGSKTQNSKIGADKPNVHQVMRELRLKDD